MGFAGTNTSDTATAKWLYDVVCNANWRYKLRIKEQTHLKHSKVPCFRPRCREWRKMIDANARSEGWENLV